MIGSVNARTGALADPKSSELDQLKAVAKQFESVFVRQMFKASRDSKLADDDLFGSDATDQFRDMQDANLADQFSEKGVFGLGDLLVKQFQARVSKAAPAGAATADAKAATAATSGVPTATAAATSVKAGE